MLKSFLNYIGMERDRTMFTWVSASEGERFAQVIKGVTEQVQGTRPGQQARQELTRQIPDEDKPWKM